MSLEALQPKFDKPFEDIFRELRERIPRFNTAWTNFNDSDPGITLLQLFAWLSEMTLHRMSDVPRKNYLKFAELLGLELEAARPATVMLAFSPKASEVPQTIPARARYSGRGGDATIMFETTRALDIIAAPLVAMFVFADGTIARRNPPADPGATAFYPLGRQPAPGDALYLAFKPTPSNSRPFPRRMRFLALRPSEDTKGVAQHIGNQNDDLIAPVTLVWEYRRQASRTDWERLRADDYTAALTRDGFIEVEGPQDIEASVETALGAEFAAPHYWIRVRLDQNRYPTGRAPCLEHLLPNAVEAVNLQTEERRPLDTSSGRASQGFDFPKRPIDPESLVIEIEPPGGAPVDKDWTRVDDFFGSKSDSKHYVLNATAGRLMFGDGENGLIPPAGSNIIAAVWRHGGGAAANAVIGGAVKTMVTQVAGVEKVTNPRAANGGGDEQKLEDFIRDTPRNLRSAGRVVTANDFEAQALKIQGVKKALALGGRHPDFGDNPVAGAITVFIVADSDDSPPAPSAELIRSVCTSLDKLRLITTEIFVAAPKFLEIRIEARLFASPTAAFDQVADAAAQRLDDYLSPLKRGFGEDISIAGLYSTLFGPPDPQRLVRSVENLIVYVDGQEHDIRKPIAIPPDALPYAGRHLIVVLPDPDEQASR